MKSGIGGTFNMLHRGHMALFERAFEISDEILVGVVSDRMALGTRKIVRPFAERRRTLQKYLSTFGKPFDIVSIDDRFGPAISSEELDFLIVSEESNKTAIELNERRKGRGLSPLEIVVVPTVIAEDFRPIRSARIIDKEIDAEGRLLVPLKVNVGSDNPVKVEAVRRILRPLYGMIEVKGAHVDSEVPRQPKEDEVIEGAINRARNAIGDAHLGIGIEAGLIWNERLKWFFDVQYCAIVDSLGKMTIGHGPGFWYPPSVIDDVKSGMSVDESMFKLTGIASIGHRMGSVGYLSKELINRTELTEIAVVTAFIPRVRPELYGRIWSG
ncbi:MAG TPA: inosine/xanthosine triphosphatase [Euryarchaeota archaeon]|nr:inosine/xanthosine triphosphatase [Euryarchaeota archaeon]